MRADTVEELLVEGDDAEVLEVAMRVVARRCHQLGTRSGIHAAGDEELSQRRCPAAMHTCDEYDHALGSLPA